MSDFSVKKGRRGNYTIIQNDIFDSGLPIDTMGLFMFLLSLPDDWKLNVKHLRNKFGIGKDRTYRMLNELIEAGYVERVETRDAEGKFYSLSYLIHETPISEDPFPENQDPEKPDAYKRLNIQKTNSIKKEKIYKKEKFSDGFEEFWKEYPNKVGKGAAIKSYQKALDSNVTPEKLMEALKSYKNYLKENDWLHAKHPTTWLNQECWHDDYTTVQRGTDEETQKIIDGIFSS